MYCKESSNILGHPGKACSFRCGFRLEFLYISVYIHISNPTTQIPTRINSNTHPKHHRNVCKSLLEFMQSLPITHPASHQEACTSQWESIHSKAQIQNAHTHTNTYSRVKTKLEKSILDKKRFVNHAGRFKQTP